MNTQKIIYKNRYEINKIFNILKLKGFKISNKYTIFKRTLNFFNCKTIDNNINYLYCYSYIMLKIQNQKFYFKFIITKNSILFLNSVMFSYSRKISNIILNDINYISKPHNYILINNKYFMQLLINIFNNV